MSRTKEVFFRLVPAFDSLRHYSLEALRQDVVAGLTVAAVAVPQAMAYALIAGLPPQYGLYTAIVMTTIRALFDSSRQLINGPTNAIAITVWSILLPLEAEDKIQAAITLCLVVGLFQLALVGLRLGHLHRFLSPAVIVGFTCGAAVLLMCDQLKNLLGISLPAGASSRLIPRFWQTISAGEIAGPWTALVGLTTIFLVLTLGWLNKRVGLKMPEYLLAVVAMSLLVSAGDLQGKGVAVVGTIPAELPRPLLPNLDLVLLRELAPGALAIAVLGLLEALAMAQALANRNGQKVDVHQQCLSEGLANLGGSFFQCFPGSGSLSRSNINQQMGAFSQWSGVFSACGVAVTVMFCAPLVGTIPYAALAGILMISAWRMVDHTQLIFHLRGRYQEAGLVLATAFTAILLSLETAILIGIFLSLIDQCVLTLRNQLQETVPSAALATHPWYLFEDSMVLGLWESKNRS